MPSDLEINLGPHGFSSCDKIFGPYTEYHISLYDGRTIFITIYRNGQITGTNSSLKFYFNEKLGRISYTKHDINLPKSLVDWYIATYDMRYKGE